MYKVLLTLTSVVFLSGCFNVGVNPVESLQQKIFDTITEKPLKALENERVVIQDNKRISDGDSIRMAAEIYFLDHATYPTLEGEGVAQSNAETWGKFEAILQAAGILTSGVPVDPLHPEKFYQYKSDGDSFTITVLLENQSNDCVMIEEGGCRLAFNDGGHIYTEEEMLEKIRVLKEQLGIPLD